MFFASLGKYTEAEPLITECFEKHKAVLTSSFVHLLLYSYFLAMYQKLGEDHPYTLQAMNNLAGLYEKLGRSAECLSMYQECMKKRLALLGADHPNTLESISHMASFYKGQGKYNLSEPLYLECLKKRRCSSHLRRLLIGHLLT